MRDLVQDARRAAGRFQEHDQPRLAAAVAFYVLFSAVPAVALMIASIGWMVRDPHEQAHVLGHLFEIIPVGSPQNRKFLADTVSAVRESSGGLSVVGLVALGWAALGMFGALRWALNRAWSARGRGGIIRVTLGDAAIGILIWLLLLVSGLGTSAIHGLTSQVQSVAAHIVTGSAEAVPGAGAGAAGLKLIWSAARWTVPAALTFVAFLFLYRYVPNVPHGMRDVFPAALIAAALFELGKNLFALYVGWVAPHQSIYGALSGVLGFMLWVYLSSVILLFGAEFAAAYTDRRVHPVRARGASRA